MPGDAGLLRNFSTNSRTFFCCDCGSKEKDFKKSDEIATFGFGISVGIRSSTMDYSVQERQELLQILPNSTKSSGRPVRFCENSF